MTPPPRAREQDPVDRAQRRPAGVWTGIDAIDDAHEALLKRIRPALNATTEPIKVLRDLQRHVLVHFQEEEEEMRAAGYPDLEEHCLAHRKVVDFVANVSVELVERGPDEEYLAVSNRLLFNWLVDHIKTVDLEFARFLRETRSR